MKVAVSALFFLAMLFTIFVQIAFLGYIDIVSNITGTLGRAVSFVSFGSFGYSSLLLPLMFFVAFLDWKMDRKFPWHLTWGLLGLFFLSLLIWSPHNNNYLINHKFFPSGYFGNIFNLSLSSIIGTYSVKFFSAAFLIFCLYQFRSSKTISWIFGNVYRQVRAILPIASKLILRMIALPIKNRSNETELKSGTVTVEKRKSNANIAGPPVLLNETEYKKTEQTPIAIKLTDTATNIQTIQDTPASENKNMLKKTNDTSNAYSFPTTKFLNRQEAYIAVDENYLREKSNILTDKLKRFGIMGDVTQIHPGPVITMFEYRPASTVKVSKVANLSDDLAMAMKALSVRIIAPLPGKGVIGIEVSNDKRQLVYLADVIDSSKFKNSVSPLAMALGKDTEGYPVVADLAKMPHLLIAGATGAGKSVGLNTMITSILYKSHPNQVKFLMIDPKVLELSVYDGIPHMLIPVVTDPNKASLALSGMVRKMEYRYSLMGKIGVKNIENYNKKVPDNEKLPYLVVVIDELADLMIVSAKKVEIAIARLAQMARASGIHLVVATQRPSVDVLTGVIKANFSARIAFKVASKIDSRTVIDTSGAEKLLGKGDMLFVAPGTSMPVRVHCAYISEYETSEVCKFLKSNSEPDYDESLFRSLNNCEEDENDSEGDEEFQNFQSDSLDANYQKAIDIVLSDKKTSISYLQRKLRIGYNRSAGYIEHMEKDGIISAPDLHGRREILLRNE